MKRTKPLDSYKRTEPLETRGPFARRPKPGSRLKNHDPLEDALDREKVLEARVEELEDGIKDLLGLVPQLDD